MSIHTGSLLFSGLASLILGGLVYLQGKNKTPHIFLALNSLMVAVWCLGQALGEIVLTKEEVFFWTRVNIGAAILIPPFFLGFILSFLEKLKAERWTLFLAAGGSILLLALDFTPFMVQDLRPAAGYRFWPVFSFGYLLFAVFLALVFLYGFYKLSVAYASASGRKRDQILYVLLASFIGIGGGATNFAPIFGLNFPALAHYSMPLYLLLTIYAILEHQLLDIRVVIKNSLVYILLTATLLGSYFILTFALREVPGLNAASLAVFLALGLALIFDPLRRRLQDLLDRLFFKEKYQHQQAIEKLSAAAVTIFDADELKELLRRTVRDLLGVDLVEIKDLPALKLSIPVISRGNKLGYINLGAKSSEEEYSEGELRTLNTLANQMAGALENAALYRQMLQNEKMAALTQLSAGLAHEIKNPLASLKGMTQSLPENIHDPQFMKDYMEIIPRQLDRINKIVENLLKIGKPKAYARSELDLTQILEEILKLAANRCQQNGIKVSQSLESGLCLEGDHEALTQAFMNLILNAIDSMPDGGELKIEAKKFGDRIGVIISDTGTGIRP